MNTMKTAIPYIYLGTGILLAALALAGCANGDARAPLRADGEANATNGQQAKCKTAIEDVSRYCSGDNASTGKCNDAKARTREHCI